MNQSDKLVSGLDIQPDYLSLAQYSPEEHAVTLVAIQPLSGAGDISPESIGRELGELKTKCRFCGTGINCALPGEYAIIEKMPVDQDEADIHDALQWELGQHLIGDVGEYAFDYEPCGTGADGLRRFLVVAYRHQQVEEIVRLLKRHKLTAAVMDLDIFALVNVFEANYPDFLERPCLIAHAESRKAKLILTHHGKYVDHECVEYGTGPDPDRFSEQLGAAAGNICSLAGLSGGVTGVPVFAAGSLFTQEGYLEKTAPLAGNVSLLDPLRKINNRIGAGNDQLSMYAAQLSVAIGLALRGNG